jgi:hypothetical protein
MKRRVCSYDMLAVPDSSFVLKDTVGEMYFCNLRCFCIWSVQLATRPNLSVEDKTGAYSLTTPSGEEHQFAGIVDVARWATALLLDKEVSGGVKGVSTNQTRSLKAVSASAVYHGVGHLCQAALWRS